MAAAHRADTAPPPPPSHNRYPIQRRCFISIFTLVLSAGYAMSQKAAEKIDVPALSIGLLFALPFVREVRLVGFSWRLRAAIARSDPVRGEA